MKARAFLGLVNGLRRHLDQFDICVLIEKRDKGEIDREQVNKLIDDVYKLEEDLILLQCGHKKAKGT